MSGQGSSDCGLRTYERCVGEAERRLSDCVSASDLDFGQYREGAEPVSNGSNGFLPVAYHLPANSSFSHLRVEPVYPALSCSLAAVLVDNHRPPLAEVMAVRSSPDGVEQGAGVPLSPRGELWHLVTVVALSVDGKTGISAGETVSASSQSSDISTESLLASRVAAEFGAREMSEPLVYASLSEKTGISIQYCVA